MNVSMSIMDSTVGTNGVILIEIGVSKSGNPIYRVSVYYCGKWNTARFKDFDSAYSTYKLMRKVLDIQ